MKNQLIVLGATIALTCCNQPAKDSSEYIRTEPPDAHPGYTSCSDTGSVTQNIPIPAASGIAYKTRSGKTLLVQESHPDGLTRSSVTVTPEGFSEDNSALEFENIDPVSKIMQADLDNDGFDELYIATTSGGSGSYGSIIALASIKDKQISPIRFFGGADRIFENTRGRDSFYIKGGYLVRQLPIYRDYDPNARPAGGYRKIYYSLHKGNGFPELTIFKVEDCR